MSTNAKKHCYTVTVRKARELPGLRYHVIAESKAQARAYIANTMIEVERTDPIDLLDLRRDQVLDASAEPAQPDPVAADPSVDGQASLPLPGDAEAEAGATAAEALETPR